MKKNTNQLSEEKYIEMVKKDPTLIKDIINPSQKVRDYAVAYFLKKYAHGR